MAPVAGKLAFSRGVLEPIQTAMTVDGQVDELRALMELHGALPVTLIGYSWGAWLSFILAARSRGVVGKLIMVSSGPFEKEYAASIQATRMSRLSAEERAALGATIAALGDAATENKSALLARLGELTARADSNDPVPEATAEDDKVDLPGKGDLFQAVWSEAAEMRRNGALLALGRRIACPVVAIHGDFDPHPADGVWKPLAGVLKDFRFILLERCGHTPWLERYARHAFYEVLERELR